MLCENRRRQGAKVLPFREGVTYNEELVALMRAEVADKC
jgi:hypothetical protein